MRPLISVITVAIIAFMLSACAIIKKDEREESFKYATKHYGALIRWSRFSNAANYLREKDGTHYPANNKLYGQLKVTHYNIASIKQHKTGFSATVVAQIDYYREPAFTVHSIIDVQEWWWDEENKKWFIDGPMPAFK